MANDYRRGIRVYLDTTDYKKGIDDLIKRNDELSKEYQQLADKAGKLTSAEKKRQKEVEAQLKKNKAVEEEYRQKLKETERVLNNLSGAAYNELISTQNMVAKQLKGLSRGTEEYNKVLEQHKRVSKAVKQAQKEMAVEIGCNANIFGKITTFATKYWTVLAAGIAAITGVSMRSRKLAEDVALLDDVYSDVMKTTGNTKDEVLALNEEFKKMDTRTSREQLNMLARDAGKLGLSGKKDILDFVEAGNQINVALGEDLGEDAIKNIGKMVGVFEKSTDHLKKLDLKGQMLAVGSAINELGASSSASEPYLVQFAGRLGGVAAQAGISIDQILGFASALDQDMQAVEMSATALQNFIMKIMGEPAKFARIAKMEVGAFSDLLKTDANAAIKAVLSSLNEQGGFQALIPIFEEMGLDGARAVGVLSSMASGIGKIDEAQRVANQAMLEGTSTTKEYNIKNENLAARLDKARERFKEVSLELGQSLNPVLLKSTDLTTNLIKVLTKYPNIIKALLVVVGLLTAVYVSQYAIKLKNFALDKLQLALTHMQRIAVLSFSAAQALLTGNLTRARAAMKLLNQTMIVNPYLAIVAAITAIGLAVYKLATRTTEAEKSLRDFNKEANSQSRELNNIFEAYKNANEGTKEKDRLLKVIKEKYGKYIQDLIDEKGNIIDIEKAQVQANKALRESIALKIKEQAITDSAREEIKEQAKIIGDINKAIAKEKGQNVANIITESISEAFVNSEKDAAKGLEEAKKILDKYGLKGAYGWNLEGLKTYEKSLGVLFSSFFRMNKEQEKIEQNFAGLISKAAEVDAIINDADDNNNDAPPPSPGDNSKTDPTAEAIKAAEAKYKQRLLNLRYWLELEQITENEFADESEKQLIEFLNKKLEIEQQAGQSTIDTENAILDARSNLNKTAQERQKKADSERLKSILDLQKSGNDAIKAGEEKQTVIMEEAAADNRLKQKQHEKLKLELAVKAAKARLALAKATYESINKAEFGDQDLKRNALSNSKSEVESLENAVKKAEAAVAKFDAETEGKFRSTSEKIQDIFGDSFSEIGKLFENFYDGLEKLKDGDLDSWEDWSADVGAIVQSGLAVAKNINDQYYEYKFNALEADKQAELTANVDKHAKKLISDEQYEKEKERIEQEYAQKELDLKKKQANADAGIKIAQTIAAGALAAIQAFAQLGPIAGAVAAALIAVTTGFQIASIIKQRNAIMATTLDNSSSSSSQSTGARVANSQLPVTAQAASGRWNVIGEDDGRTYRNVPYIGVARTGVVTTPTLVGERGEEIIIDNPTVRNIRMNAPYLLGMLRQYRVPQRVSGKWNTAPNESANYTNKHEISNSQQLEENTAVMKEVLALLLWLKENRIEAYMIISEFEKKRDLRDKSLRKGSLS